MKEKKIFAVQIPEELNTEYVKIANERGMSKSQCVRSGLTQALNEDVNRAALACAVTILSDKVRKNKDNLSEEDYQELCDLIEQITKLLK